MSELGDLLELLHRAAGGFTTVRGVARSWEHHGRRLELHRRAVEGRGGSSSSGIVAFSTAGSDEPPPETTETTTRVWIERPDRIREETDGQLAGTRTHHTLVQVGATWWSYGPDQGAMTNEGSPDHGHGLRLPPHTLDPFALLGELILEPGDRVERAGRPGLAVHARSRPREPWMGQGAGLLAVAGEHELVIDLERGVLLEDVALLDGEPVSRLTLEELVFDQSFPPGTFVFQPPPGTRLQRVAERYRPPASLPLHEVARRAPFTVFAFRELPEGWQLHARLPPGDADPDVPPVSVHLHYHAADASVNLGVTQQAADWNAVPVEGPEWRTATRDGHDLHVATMGHGPFTSRLVIADRDGTRIQLQTGELSEDELLDLAARLAPVSPDAPPLPS